MKNLHNNRGKRSEDGQIIWIIRWIRAKNGKGNGEQLEYKLLRALTNDYGRNQKNKK